MYVIEIDEDKIESLHEHAHKGIKCFKEILRIIEDAHEDDDDDYDDDDYEEERKHSRHGSRSDRYSSHKTRHDGGRYSHY